MIYVKIHIQERATLQNAMKAAKSVGQYRRCKAIDLSSQGYAVPKIVEVLDLSEATIRRLIHHVNEAGVSALQPAYGQGRPRH